MPVEHTAPDQNGSGVARSRERFLAVDERPPQGVRQEIVASWRRSRHSGVEADRLAPQFVDHADGDTPLTRSVDPVLRQLQEQVAGQPLSIVLTDATGLVLRRITGDSSLERHLDRINLAPGFSYAESVVGTNGIGSALEAGRAMHVFGHEHFAERLEDLACAGAPIRHPVSGKTIGVLNLTCWQPDAGQLLMTLAKATAEQMRDTLMNSAGARETALLHAYLRACRHSTGMVFGLDENLVMMNTSARSTLDPLDQASLLQHAGEALAERRGAASVALPSGALVRIHAKVLPEVNQAGCGVVEVKLLESPAVGAVEPVPSMLLPGLIGNGTLWRRACREAEAVGRSGSWLLVQGETGSGRTALLLALQQRLDPTGHCITIDGAEALGPQGKTWTTRTLAALAAPTGTCVLRNLDQLPAPALRVLTSALQDAGGRRNFWVAAAVSAEQPGPALARLLTLFATTVQVPPLRHHVTDVEQLVPFLLRRLAATVGWCAQPKPFRSFYDAAGPATSPS